MDKQQIPRRALIVEDDLLLRKLLEAVITTLGYELLTAATVQEARAILATNDVEVVVTDIDLADGSSGYELLDHIASSQASPRTILMSGHNETQVQATIQGRYESAPTVLHKPFTLETLRYAIEN